METNVLEAIRARHNEREVMIAAFKAEKARNNGLITAEAKRILDDLVIVEHHVANDVIALLDYIDTLFVES